MAASSSPRWDVVGASVRGASHLRNGLPNQDAIGWQAHGAHDQAQRSAPDGAEDRRSDDARLNGARAESAMLLAVSDGHGSNRCFRSDQGSALAVRCALEAMGQFKADPAAGLDALELNARELLARPIVESWREAVQGEMRLKPLTPEELDLLEKRDGSAARQSVESDPIVAYGATLLAILVTDRFILYLQLGDGDILCISDSVEVRKPVPKDERLMGNETTSLCLPSALRDVRIAVEALDGEGPALILAATDGYANSFRDEAGFLQVASDLLAMIRTDGLDPIKVSLAGWLSETSQAGSGDDISLGLLCRYDIARAESRQEHATGDDNR